MIDTYKSLCTEFYDLDKPKASKEALEYYLREIKKSTGPVLEPMCGSGRFLIPILEEGFKIHGADASIEMLNSCKQKCRLKNLHPTLFFQKIQDMLLPDTYGMIFIPSGSFGLIIQTNEIQASLKKLHSYLIPIGQLILEIFTPYKFSHEGKINKREVSRFDLSKIVLTTTAHFDINTKIEITKCEYQNLVDNKLTLTEIENINVRHYQINEFANLLKSNGFSEIEALRPYTDEQAGEQDGMVLFKCKRID